MSVRRLAPPEQQPKLSPSRRRISLGEDSRSRKYPAGRQASAVIPLLWRAQEQDGGWLPREGDRTSSPRCSAWRYIRVLEVATFYTMFQLQPVGKKAHVQVCGTTPCSAARRRGSVRGLQEAHPARSVRTLRRRQFLVGRGRMSRRLRERADGADLEGHLRRPDGRELRQAASTVLPAGIRRSPARRSTGNFRRRSAARRRSRP